MTYSLLDFQGDMEAQAEAGLEYAAQKETQRNITNAQIEQADKQQKKGTLATVSGAMAQSGMQEGYKAYKTTQAANDAAHAAEVAGNVDAINKTAKGVNGAVSKAATLSKAELSAAGLGDGVVTASNIAPNVTVPGATTTAATAGAKTAAATGAKTAATVGAKTAATAGANAAAATGSATAAGLGAMGPVGWAGLAGLLAVPFLD